MINVISSKLHLKLELFPQRIPRLFRIKVEGINRIQRRLDKVTTPTRTQKSIDLCGWIRRNARAIALRERRGCVPRIRIYQRDCEATRGNSALHNRSVTEG